MGNIRMTNGQLSGDLEANNINLLGDLISTNIFATDNLVVDKELIAYTAHVLGDVTIDGILAVPQIVTCGLDAGDVVRSERVETCLINSPRNINIVAGPDHSVAIPNIRYNVDLCNLATISPIMIKSNKIFVVNKNILLQADPSCDGIEIIIYNQNVATIIVRDITLVLEKLESQHAVKIVYIASVCRWAKI